MTCRAHRCAVKANERASNSSATQLLAPLTAACKAAVACISSSAAFSVPCCWLGIAACKRAAHASGRPYPPQVTGATVSERANLGWTVRYSLRFDDDVEVRVHFVGGLR